jgi:hypothetical protein
MPTSTWPERLARGFAVLRGAMLILYCLLLILAPEKVVPGSSAEPARSLALMFASRTVLVGVAFTVLGMARKQEGLAWVLLADAVLQLFDAGMAIVAHRYNVVVLPLAIGAIEVWAALVLLRAARSRRHPA